jgi:hypothetical protein
MLIKYKCNLCDNEIQKYFHRGDKQANFLSCQCGGVLERQVPDFGTSSLEYVDTGVSAKRVELRKDAAARAKERGDKYIEAKSSSASVLGKKEGQD